MEEPSVLDYIKSKLFPRKYPKLVIPGMPGERHDAHLQEQAVLHSELIEKTTSVLSKSEVQPSLLPSAFSLPWRGLSALILALLAQSSLSPGVGRDWKMGSALLILSLGLLIWSAVVKELRLTPGLKEASETDPPRLNPVSLSVGGFLTLVALISFGGLQFSVLNIILLAVALWFVARGFWIPRESDRAWRERFGVLLQKPQWNITIRGSTLAALAVLAFVGFFRFYRLSDVPPEMNSDHAEKFLDVLRVLAGQNLIFFASNGGREALQFYLVAGLHKFLHLPLNFLVLKLVTSMVGFLALPYMYLLGREIGGPRVGVLTFLLAGIAYWPNVVARVGLRLPFYMLFSAALLYYLVRGFRRGNRNDFILAGIALGLAFYGYAADRILPMLVLTAFVLYIIHRQAAGNKIFALVSLLCTAAVSLVIFMPLFRYILAEPESFFLRMFTRMGSWERPIEGSVITIFLGNAARALAMFSWDAGVVWPISIPGFPALSMVSGALFYLGAGLILIRYLRKRGWVDLFLLVSIPILLLPSMLAIAFPSENPNLYRTCAAVAPVFLLAALALDSLMSAIQERLSGEWGRRAAFGLAGLLLAVNSVQDYNLVFVRYYESYLVSSWNSSEMGLVAKDFIEIHQTPDNVWVIGFPNWVDTRLVANNAGFPGRDYELKIENIPVTLERSGPKLFILNPEDIRGLDSLRQYYPTGWLKQYSSHVSTKDFLIYYVLPNIDISIDNAPSG